MKILGATVAGDEATLVALDDTGRLRAVERAASLPDLAARVAALVRDEPFALAVDLPVVVPTKATKSRPVENLIRRRFGYRLPPGGRAAFSGSVPGETLLAGLATAGQPCMAFPDRDRRRSGLAESWPGLTLKSLLWLDSPLAAGGDVKRRRELFRGYLPSTYRRHALPARVGWIEQLARLDGTVRALGSLEGYDLDAVSAAIGAVADADDCEAAAALFDATLGAGTLRRYIESPERTLFAGEQESGYAILPADDFVRSLTGETRATAGRLFPTASLRDRLGRRARLRSVDLLSVPGRPQRIEASFNEPPHYEFDNLDEMLWWKHTRHLDGEALPTEGLRELAVELDGDDATLRLVRSRHRTLSYRFDPPGAWRGRIATRDGKTYRFRVTRALYDTAPEEGADA